MFCFWLCGCEGTTQTQLHNYTKSKEVFVLYCVVVSLFALSFWLGVKLFNFIKVYNYIYIVRCEHEGVV